MWVTASSLEMRLASTSTRGCQKVVRPTAKPMNPGTLAAVFSQCTTRSRSAPRPLHHLDTLFQAIEPFDLPHIRLNPSILQGLDGLHHQARAYLQVIGVL